MVRSGIGVSSLVHRHDYSIRGRSGCPPGLAAALIWSGENRCSFREGRGKLQAIRAAGLPMHVGVGLRFSQTEMCLECSTWTPCFKRKLARRNGQSGFLNLRGLGTLMAKTGEPWRADFEQAMGEPSGEAVCPPVPFESASAHECCEVIWSVLGLKVTPRSLTTLTQAQIVTLSQRIAEYF